ncbi:hypothetical protein MCAP1_001501 [Malassezia caprae]|uniref:PUM-HD domain-containing protein n=1 Tax=Malassezia caprae TaxID=1381934 RepID=A0AAF0E810_9BASI|nr:hypothetical protein MCAP1_001501 [Malassezia caprae]
MSPTMPGNREFGAETPPPTIMNARNQPRRTLTDNASEFLHAVDDLLAGGPTTRHMSPLSNAMPTYTDTSRSTHPLLHRSMTIDSLGYDPASHLTQSLHLGISSPLLSTPPTSRPSDDRSASNVSLPAEWGAADYDPRANWPSARMHARTADPLMFGPLGGVLSSSPDTAETPLHAEASAAIAFEDDLRTLTASPPSFLPPQRAERFDAPKLSSPMLDHSLAKHMRSMTLPNELPYSTMREQSLSNTSRMLNDSPPVSAHSRAFPRSALHQRHPPAYVPAPYSPTVSHPTETLDFGPMIGTGAGPLSTDGSMSPRGQRRDEANMWFGRPGTLRLGEAKPAGLGASHASLDAETTSVASGLPRARYDYVVQDSPDVSVRRCGSGRGRGGHPHDGHSRMGQRRDDSQGRGGPGHDEGSRWELADVRGQLAEISMDQHGSRLIQEKLDRCMPEERTWVFEELFPESRRLMADVFGNYVIQKLFEYGSPEQVAALGEQLQGHVLNLSLGTYGCRVVQKAFERVDEKQKIQLGQELHPHVFDCVRDQNANHVIQKILEQVPSAHLEFIAAAFKGHVLTLASHCYSCRVLQRIFAYCDEGQRRPLLDEMHQNTLRLMQDQYGNYVIQWVLQHGDRADQLAIVAATKTHLLQMSRHKFASNVVEHVIEVAPPADLRDLLKELLAPLSAADVEGLPLLIDGTMLLCVATVMMQDQYANYVLQRFLQVLQGEDRERLVQTIRPVLYALRQRQAALAAQTHNGLAFTGSIRLPGNSHIGNKPLQAIERLIEQPSSSTAAAHTPAV